jgi:diaminopimelate epimerase
MTVGSPKGHLSHQIAVTKHHGLGNDFLVLCCLGERDRSPSIEIGAALARELCSRHTGIGADGLLIASRPFNKTEVDVVMRLHNADGSVAEMSGNGIRCFAQAVVDCRFREAGVLRVHTDAGLRVVSALASDANGLAMIRVDMGVAKVDSFEVPPPVKELIGEHRFVAIDVGNPHLVIERDLETVDIASFGPAVETHFMSQFGGMNVEIVSVNAVATDVVDMIVWERGVGITQACGTGATATAIATNLWGLTGTSTVVRQPGGSASVELHGESVTLIGPSQFVARCTVKLNEPWEGAPT